ncbi:MAG: zinc ribbon domain-containing protein [Verrucomicrobiae bacterium]|nr:zinc ribbon domain-containing protein [Verrucomicrobiae bacterium]
MTSQAPKAAVVLLIISLVVSMMLSIKIHNGRDPVSVKTAKGGNSLFTAGFQKALSHFAWMRLIQLRGGMDKVTPERADILIKKYDNLTNLDPMFAKAYEDGALDIGWTKPEKSLELLDKAIELGQIKSWRLPFTAAFIAKMRLQKDPKNLERAIKYIELAANAPDRPSYVKRFEISLKAEVAKDETEVLDLWVKYYTGGSDRFVEMGGRGMGIGGDMEDDGSRRIALNRISKISASIINAAQTQLQGEKDPSKRQALEKRVSDTRKIASQVYGGSRICPKCFKPYQAGDRFCPNDGQSVTPYGICSKCGEVTRGAFCQKCSTPVAK